MDWCCSGFILAGMLVCASLCYGGPMDCVAHQLPNGSVTYVLPKPLCPGEWSFNNTVIAFNEDNGTEYNKTLVSALAEDFITLKSCKHTLTYRKDCAAKPHTIRCSHNCSAMDLTPSGMQGFSSRFHRGCLAALVIPAIVLGILILCASRKVCCFNTTQEKERPSSTC